MCLHIGVGICIVSMADAVMNDNVSCYNVIIQVRSLQLFVEMISQGYYSGTQQPLACWHSSMS